MPQPLLLQCSFHARHLIILPQNIRQWTNRRDLILIDLPMALGVVLLDMLKLRRVPECRIIPVQVSHPLVKRRVPTSNVPNIALEVLHIHGIEANDGRVQTDISFCDCRRGEEVRR
jgi:hypothetical protein